MKIKSLLLTAVLSGACLGATAAAPAVNLTPAPKEITVGTGTLRLPSEFMISYGTLPAGMVAEIDKFIGVFNHATGLTATRVQGAEGLMMVEQDTSLAAEGYRLHVTTSGVEIKAATPAGLFYAFQTIKKVLPANVMVNVSDPSVTYELKVMNINDEPRYAHRGYELDCARHFFEVDQVKKMIDVMSYYKMNRLHWHLTDDQGWRIEVPKYPKLITAAATAPNVYWWDFDNGYEYYKNEPYGPYYYTVDELKEVVAYARERHIEVIPEVDMPGHMEAAIAAYPEFSCNPGGSHSVRYWPGVSTDILNLANPAVVQFCKDVMDELIEVFPYEYIHIGGDECPKTAWNNSAEVQELMSRLGLTSPNALQTWFTKEIADYVKPKGRRLICWNEVLTSEGADTKMLQDADVLIYDWLGGARSDGPSWQAAKLGLRSVWCSTYHYYIDYSQWSGSSEPRSMSGPITLETIYNVKPSTTTDPVLLPYYYGVQCNLWTEYVAEPKHVEYNSLPRMIAVAETGWTPDAKKNFEDFKARFNADTRMLDLGNYTYGRHYVEDAEPDPDKVYPKADHYYRLVTRASHDENRRDRCIELVRDGSPLISEKSAQVNKLWTNVQVAADNAAYDWQYWTFEQSPDNPERYAMVCKAAPAGSVSPSMQGSSVNARWSYDTSAKHYNFVLGEHFGLDNGAYYYSVRSDKNSSWWLNCAQAAQNQCVNNWSDPTDGNGGVWTFVEEGEAEADVNPEFNFLTEGAVCLVENSIPDYQGLMLCDENTDSYLRHTSDPWGTTAWRVTSSTTDTEHNVQTLALTNVATGRHIAAVSADATTSTSGTGFFSGNAGYPVTMGSGNAAAVVTLTAYEGAADLKVAVGGKNLYPLSVRSMVLPGTVAAGNTAASAGNAVRNQGAAWTFVPATVYTYHCTDAEGHELATVTRAVKSASDFDPLAELPAIANHSSVDATVDATDVNVTYRRDSFNLVYVCTDSRGIEVARVTEPVALGSEVKLAAPQVPYCTFSEFTGELPQGTLQADAEVHALYTTTAYFGVKSVGRAVSRLESGRAYLIYDAHAERHCFRYATGAKQVWGSNNIEGASPFYTWQLEAKGNNFAVKNLGYDLYLPAVAHGSVPPLTDAPYAFVFKYNSSAETWQVKNSGNSEYWDGNAGNDFTMAGWTGGGHPYKFYEFVGEPFFKVSVTEQDADGTVLLAKSMFVPAGESYFFVASSRPGLAVSSVSGATGLDRITDNVNIVVTYTADGSGLNELVVPSQPGVADAIYDLQGRRVARASRPGIYIVNGHKMLIK